MNEEDQLSNSSQSAPDEESAKNFVNQPDSIGESVPL